MDTFYTDFNINQRINIKANFERKYRPFSRLRARGYRHPIKEVFDCFEQDCLKALSKGFTRASYQF